MDAAGINSGFVLLQLCPVIFLLLFYTVPVMVTLRRLKEQQLSDTATAIWALLILIVPIAGALVYFYLNPLPDSEDGSG
jgi:uncharacterized membrane protein YhaH (DUF805 family)